MTNHDIMRASPSTQTYCVIGEDSFAAHLRSECAESHDILPSHAVLHHMEPSPKYPQQQHPNPHHDEAEPLEQVLGGFASLGLDIPDSSSTARNLHDGPPSHSQHDESDALEDDSISPEPDFDRWTYFSASATATDPLATLDIMSIDEMGLHSVDIGNVNDWEGCTLSANVVCSQTTPPQRKTLAWSIARSKKRQRKWVVVPDLDNVMQHGDVGTEEDRGLRTVIVSSKPLLATHQLSELEQHAPSPFSGRAGYEFKFLRQQADTCNTTLFLANPETHRIVHNFRAASPVAVTADVSIVNSPQKLLAESASKGHPVYPVLRRSRSRPYMRQEHQPLRRSRSKPYLRASANSQSQVQDKADFFAPSLPGAPGAQYQPEESWPSARHAASPSSGGSTRTSSGTNSSHSSLGPGATIYSQSSTCGMSEATSSAPSKAPQAAMGNSPDSESGFPGHLTSPFEKPSFVFTAAPGPSPRTSTNHEGRIRPSIQSAREEWYQRLPAGAELTRVQSHESKQVSTPGSESVSSAKKRGGRHRKDRRLSGWFKKKVGMPGSSTLPEPEEARSGLTRKALEQIGALVDRAESPESTIMGSRRGSECVTQAAERIPIIQMLSPQEEEPIFPPPTSRLTMEESHQAVAASLARIYGWSGDIVSTLEETQPMDPRTYFGDIDEENTLLGMENVPPQALTMLIPLPLLGRSKSEKVKRYMRIIFVPFLSAPTGQPSTWYRRLGLAKAPSKRTRAKSEGSCIEAFRVSALILGEARTFPVVLGFCDGRRGIEMVPEGWAALGLSPPQMAVVDIVLAASAAIMHL